MVARRRGGVFPEALKPLFSVLWLENISGNEMINAISGGGNYTITNKDFSTNYIPSTSTATFALSNTASLKVDDQLDTLHYNDAGTVQQITASFLTIADYSRTLVRYTDDAPHNIKWIGVLKSTANPTADEWNQLHSLFRLHPWWSGTFNPYGVIKANRAGEAQPYKAWTARVTALGYTLPATLTKEGLNHFWLDIIKLGPTIIPKLDCIWMWGLKDTTLALTTACVAFVRPTLALPTFPVAPTFTNAGFEGNAIDQYCNSQFNASINGIKYVQDDATRFHYKYKVGAGNSGLDGHPSFTGSNTMQNSSTSANRINDDSNSVAADFKVAGLVAIGRSGSLPTQGYADGVVSTGSSNSIALINEKFSILRSAFGYSDAGIMFSGYAAFLTSAELNILNTAGDRYKAKLGV